MLKTVGYYATGLVKHKIKNEKFSIFSPFLFYFCLVQNYRVSTCLHYDFFKITFTLFHENLAEMYDYFLVPVTNFFFDYSTD